MAKNCSGFSPLPDPPSCFGRERLNFSPSHLTSPLRPAPLAVAVAVYYFLQVDDSWKKCLKKIFLTFISFSVTMLLDVEGLAARNERREDQRRLLEREAVIVGASTIGISFQRALCILITNQVYAH